jgi:hypothetical protein
MLRLRLLTAAVLVGGVLGAGLSGQSPAAGAVTGACHVSPIVADLDRSARFHHDLLGLDLVPAPTAKSLPWDKEPGHPTLHGLPEARLRFVGARMPGVRCGVEMVEFDRVDRKAVHRRMQDPGSAMLGLPAAGAYRVATAEFPGTSFVLELIEFRGVGEARTVRSRVQDPGSYRLQLKVKDIDDTLRTLQAADSRVVSSGGQPVRMTFGGNPWRLGIAEDPNNLFLVLQQRLQP